MSTENLIAFQARVASDTDLQQKLLAIQRDSARALAEKMAALSLDVGTPFTVEEFLAPPELSDDQLDGVVGGFGGFFGGSQLSPVQKAANDVMLAHLRASNFFGTNFPKEAYPGS